MHQYTNFFIQGAITVFFLLLSRKCAGIYFTQKNNVEVIYPFQVKVLDKVLLLRGVLLGWWGSSCRLLQEFLPGEQVEGEKGRRGKKRDSKPEPGDFQAQQPGNVRKTRPGQSTFHRGDVQIQRDQTEGRPKEGAISVSWSGLTDFERHVTCKY